MLEGSPFVPLLDASRQRIRRLWPYAAVSAAFLVAAAVLGWLPISATVIGCVGVLLIAIIPSGAGTDSATTRLRARGEGSSLPDAPALLAALPGPSILLDARGVVVLFNSAAAEAFPTLRQGDALSLILRIPELIEAVRTVRSGEAADLVVEYSDRVPVDRWTRASVSAVRSGGAGELEGILLALTDQTELRRAERMRVDFVANASHELRTPLAALLGFIETLQGPAREDTAARGRFLEIMRGQATRMARLVDDLLSLSRIEQKLHVRPVEAVDLVEITKGVLDGLTPLAAERAVVLEPAIPRGSVLVRGDRDELIRVVENLVENGIKYGQSGGRVRVGLQILRSGGRDEAVIAIRDFGPGIAAEHLPRLTERFYRVDAGESRDKGGTGLGLAIVKHILLRHRGRLVVESEPGAGATFSVILERLTGAAVETPAEQVSPERHADVVEPQSTERIAP